jgi:hypothetical protein
MGKRAGGVNDGLGHRHPADSVRKMKPPRIERIERIGRGTWHLVTWQLRRGSPGRQLWPGMGVGVTAYISMRSMRVPN